MKFWREIKFFTYQSIHEFHENQQTEKFLTNQIYQHNNYLILLVDMTTIQLNY